MKILVTGGAGFIGHHLIKKLLKENHSVWSIDNYSTGKKSNEIKGCEYYYKNIKEKFSRFPKNNHINFDLCFHIAALARIQPSFNNPADTIYQNYIGTLNIVDFCRLNNIPIIYSGSSSFHSGLWKSPYAYSKYAGEQLLELYNKVYNLKCVTCRFYNVYGEKQIETGEYATVIGIFEKLYRENNPLTIVGDGMQRRDFTHVYDIIDALYKCGIYILNHNQFVYKIFELGSGKNFSILEIAKMFGEDYPILYLDKRPGEYQSTLADYTLAKKLLNWRPRVNLKKYIKNII